MAKILRLSDRIKISINELTFWIAPLDAVTKKEIGSCTKMQGGKETYDLFEAQIIYLKHGLKKVEGLESYSGKPYELSFNGDVLTDECVSEILSIETNQKLMECAWTVLNGVTDAKVEGATIEVESGK